MVPGFWIYIYIYILQHCSSSTSSSNSNGNSLQQPGAWKLGLEGRASNSTPWVPTNNTYLT